MMKPPLAALERFGQGGIGFGSCFEPAALGVVDRGNAAKRHA
jgi:hypothetical protein